MEITTIGLDLAKSVFQVHGIGADGTVVLRKRLKRRQVLSFFEKRPPCLVGMEACGSAHHWAREIIALGHHCEADVTQLREALCQTFQERRSRCGGDL